MDIKELKRMEEELNECYIVNEEKVIILISLYNKLKEALEELL